MDLTIEKMERLARHAAGEAEVFVEVLWAACDSNLLWRIVFSGRSNVTVIVFVDAHDFNKEHLIRDEIRRQLRHHVTVNNLAALRRTSGTTMPAFALDAFEIGMMLWKEANGNNWGAEIEKDKAVVNFTFEAEDLTHAKLHVSTVAREMAVKRLQDSELPSCKSVLDLWRHITIVRPQ